MVSALVLFSSMTIQDLLEFVNAERQKRGVQHVMHRWSDSDIVRGVRVAIRDNAFGWVEINGKLAGFAFGIPRPHERVFDVQQVVCSTPRALAHLLLLFQSQYQGWTLRGLRKKKCVEKRVVDYKQVERFSHLAQVKASQII